MKSARNKSKKTTSTNALFSHLSRKKIDKLSSLSKDKLLEMVVNLQSELFTLKHLHYARKSEKINMAKEPSPLDLLFNEAEHINAKEGEDFSDKDDSETKPKKARGKRRPLPEGFQRERVEHDLNPEEKICKVHGTELIKIGEEITEQLDIIPASIKVLQNVVSKYKCPCCSKEHDKEVIITSKKTKDPIPKSIASSGLLAHIVVSKFEDSLPLYRQEKIFQRCEIDINRNSMSRWMIKLAGLSQPIINLLRENILSSKALHCDESTVQVLKEEGRNPEQKSYMWAIANTLDKPSVIFNYSPSRNKNSARELLDGYKGTIICDGYKVYDSLANDIDQSFKIAGCMAHCRRKFFLAHKETPNDKTLKIRTVLDYIDKLYKIEKRIKYLPPDKKLEIRTKKSIPIMETIKDWVDKKEAEVLPISLLGRAISYTQNQWDKLMEFTKDPFVSIDNNYLEAQIKHFAVGRKNWLFSASVDGAHASSVMYSLIASSKANGLDPHKYLRLIFKELPYCEKIEDYEKLLPYNISKHFTL